MNHNEAVKKAGEDSDYQRRGLFDAIHKGNFPGWTLKWQVMPYEDARTYRITPFDLTKTWPHADYPLLEVGKVMLNENPVNWDAQIVQLAITSRYPSTRPGMWMRSIPMAGQRRSRRSAASRRGWPLVT